jgi:hypothetical protein
VRGHARPLVAELRVELGYEELLVGGEGALLEVGAEVVGPAQAAALAAAQQAGHPLHCVPVPLAVVPDVVHEHGILRGRPRALLEHHWRRLLLLPRHIVTMRMALRRHLLLWRWCRRGARTTPLHERPTAAPEKGRGGVGTLGCVGARRVTVMGRQKGKVAKNGGRGAGVFGLCGLQVVFAGESVRRGYAVVGHLAVCPFEAFCLHFPCCSVVAYIWAAQIGASHAWGFWCNACDVGLCGRGPGDGGVSRQIFLLSFLFVTF